MVKPVYLNVHSSILIQYNFRFAFIEDIIENITLFQPNNTYTPSWPVSTKLLHLLFS